MVSSMNPRHALLFLAIALCGCAPTEEGHVQAILGAVLIDGLGGPPLSNSVVIAAGGRIRDVGPRSAIPIPAEADKIDGSGKVIVPQPVDICDRADPPGDIHAATADEARRRVAELAAKKTAVLYLEPSAPEIAEAVLEAARAAGIPVLARISKLAEARFLVDRGASGFIGMIRDTEDLDPAFVGRLRSLRIVFAPALLHAGAGLDAAKRNTLKLFRAGVPMAAASEGGDLQTELELLADAGLPPLD